MHDLNSVYYFAKIVEHGSLTGASRVLDVSKSVLSQHLAKLEDSLGVRLLHRSTRQMRITDVGVRYYERCRVVLEELERATAIVDDELASPRGQVRVACTPGFSEAVLTPMLIYFMSQNPEIDVRLDRADGNVDLIAQGYDIVLHVLPDLQPSANYVVRAFDQPPQVIVASPALVERHGLPRAPGDLASMAAIRVPWPDNNGGIHMWKLTGPDGSVELVGSRLRLETDDIFSVLDAAIAGCGAGALPMCICEEAIRQGRLVRLLPDWSPPMVKLYMLYPSRKGLPRAQRALIDFLCRGLRSNEDQGPKPLPFRRQGAVAQLAA